MNDKAGAVRLSGFLQCLSKDDVELVRRHLPEHLRLTRAEPGCLSFEVSESDDSLIWQVEELFADRAAFDFHQQRTRASEWFRATSAIPRDYEITTLA
ncbi:MULTISPECIES: putative quinol monooxygenase [Agrobacterium]|jgi:quinol monooxygenase YgiN|uniref:putative quinol monooxygenase n=1 Tax=Agrobacterium TaxID=357 RepID=UPI001658EC18|nr:MULTISPECIES: putative quinol monooxygenase [Agrobacterium]MCZ7865133.1 putative quinol monooxygenase [Agrobacterium salinitolerans]MCZ7888439.1 putative quinol monooxygenase [Agrobacterium salinitolerans]MDA5639754.1 putative quinol monooxygenase [Agrobacterium sp. ST15.13.013]MDA6999614.1 putative quinol monooxygenase [Agrobacterium salinitolerans]QXC49140.1 antibiotic biosynthesis monooxygenase [Agrobacterium salinitolerans]